MPEFNFKFEVGGLVASVLMVEGCPKGTIPMPMQIVERMAVECPGGVQYQYSVRRSGIALPSFGSGPGDGRVAEEYERFNEVELTDFAGAKAKAEKVAEELKAEREKREKRRYARDD